MCGIAGKVSFSEKKVSSQAIAEMNAAIAHRGPDDSGVYLSPDKTVGLGQQRLSIIDLSPLGHQPMRYLDRYEIVFNGEIYNFQEKRDLLIAKGYSFASQSDTEVILALYAEYGKRCVDHLRGMFAFAIYDEQEQNLFCARDRVGKKPFKYYLDDQVFLFGSELKAILTQPEYAREPDYEAIHHYLTLQYVPAPLTGFKGIRKLRPAHTLTLDLKTKEITEERYWKLDYSTKWNLSESGWKEKIIEKLDESVKLRMISDVPLGAFLSGGIDSSAIVALMSRHSTTPVKTFSIGFKEQKYNELPYAKMVAEKFGTEHHEFIVESNAIEHLPMLVRQYEEPFADSSALPTYLVSKHTREFVTVALNGDGGDENFAGYGRYSVLKFSLFYEYFRLFHNLLIAPLVNILATHLSSPFLVRVKRFSDGIKIPYNERYLDYLSYFTDGMKKRLYTADFYAKTKHLNSTAQVSSRFTELGAKNRTEQAVGADLLTYLPDDLQAKVDIATMAVSLEGRAPFLDHELLELTAKIPLSLKLKGWNNKKYILKEALRGLVPDEVMFRPKMGFGIPVHDWFRAELKEYTEGILLSPKALKRNIFTKEALTSFLSDHYTKKADYGYQIWALLTLELWFQEYFDHE
jgi:asparagine synthase (glutamine-hydrolysing)